jgi:hypothetical protein
MLNVVTILVEAGHEDIARTLQELTEQVAGSSGQGQIRQEIIENLVFVGQQAALRPERRNQGLLKAALSYAKVGVQTLGMPEVWNTFGQAIEDFVDF